MGPGGPEWSSCGWPRQLAQWCGVLRIRKKTDSNRTGSHRIAQDRTDLAIDALLHGLLLAKWSCRIAPGTLVAGRFSDHRDCERRAEFNLEIESVRSCR